MSSTYARLHVHLVWATKERHGWLSPDHAPRVHGIIAARGAALGCVALAVGGVDDHVHVLVGLKPDVAVATIAREIKANASAFVHREIGIEAFEWQAGYGAFSLRDTELELVRLYVRNQVRHHADGTLVHDWERVSPPNVR